MTEIVEETPEYTEEPVVVKKGRSYECVYPGGKVVKLKPNPQIKGEYGFWEGKGWRAKWIRIVNVLQGETLEQKIEGRIRSSADAMQRWQDEKEK